MDESRPNELTPSHFAWPGRGEVRLDHVYSRPGLEVEIDRDAMEWPGGHPAWDLDEPGWNPDAPASVWIRDFIARVEYYVEAREDRHGRPRLLSLAFHRLDDADEHGTDDELIDPALLWPLDRLAFIAVGCARRSTSVRAQMTEDELLHYVAAEAQRCELLGESVSASLALTLGPISPRTVTRLLSRAAAAGLIPERRRGRPSTSPRKDPIDA